MHVTSSNRRVAGFLAMLGLSLAGMAGTAQAQTPLGLNRADGAQTPVLVYPPRKQTHCPATLILSHGLGGDETGLSSLAMAMAAQGWRVIAMGHRESGRAVLRDAFQAGQGLGGINQAAREPAAHAARIADLEATYRFATRNCRPPVMALAGHSMGAQTTMMEAGATARIGRLGSDRFDAYVALSPQGIGSAFAAGAWASVRKPVLMVTGTRDRSVDGDYTTRLSAFEGLPPGRKRLAILPGAGHLQVGNGDPRVYTLVGEFLGQISSGQWAPSRSPHADTREK
jgi:pimeloyl-ACP methyl ester carboxylesterase